MGGQVWAFLQAILFQAIHILLPVGTNGKPLLTIGKFPSAIGKLMVKHWLQWGGNYQCYDW